MKKDCISGAEFPLSDLKKIVQAGITYKKAVSEGRYDALPDLSHKIVTLLFANPSLRTRLSFESGLKLMGAGANIMNAGDSWQFEYQDGVVMDGGKQEHIKEAARVVSQYCDVVGLRSSELITTAASQNSVSSYESLRLDQPIRQLAKYATRPVINMESNMYHPCQALADMMTMTEQFGGGDGSGVASGDGSGVAKKKYVLTWAPHPKALPLATPHSQFLTPAMFGMNVVVAHPEGFDLDPEVVALARAKAAESGGTVAFTHDQNEAFAGADVVVAKSWASMRYFGKWDEEKTHRAKFTDWTVSGEKMRLTNNAYFMHCLPVRRNVVVMDEVLDGDKSLIIQEAGNRMWAQMGLVAYILDAL